MRCCSFRSGSPTAALACDSFQASLQLHTWTCGAVGWTSGRVSCAADGECQHPAVLRALIGSTGWEHWPTWTGGAVSRTGW